MKSVLSIKESNFNAKMGQNFHICSLVQDFDKRLQTYWFGANGKVGANAMQD